MNFNVKLMRPISNLFLISIIIVLAACSQKKRKSQLDFSGPGNVLQAVFSAAKSQDFFELSGLCDPLKKNDGDTTDICQINKDHKDKKSFLRDFKRGRINGITRVLGNRARVPFLYGSRGTIQEIMHLVRRGEKWYLYKY